MIGWSWQGAWKRNWRGRANVAEGRTEGRTEMYAKWEAWNRRRTAAEEKGEPFDEPPPSKD